MVPPIVTQHVPPNGGANPFVRRLKAGNTLLAIVLSRSLWGCWVHWDGRRTSPHLAEQKTCPGCRRGNPKKWLGYLHIYNQNTAHVEFLELTPLSARLVLDSLSEGEDLRGNRFKFERGKGDKARIKVELIAHYSTLKVGKELPPAADPLPTLAELWGCGELRLGDAPDRDLPWSGVA